MSRIALIAAVCALVLIGPAGLFKAGRATQVTIGEATWTVELATTPAERTTGLAGRRKLAPGTGMLFIFPRSQVLRFWMRGCWIDLDVAFIDSDLRVVKIHTMAVEPDGSGRVVYSSEVPAKYALEVAAGSFGRADVKIGRKVTLSGKIRLPS